MHGLYDVKLGTAAMRDFRADQCIRDDADHFASRLQRRVGNRAHEAQPPATIDDADAALGQGAADMARRFDIDGISR
jgi:hypothetical protein